MLLIMVSYLCTVTQKQPAWHSLFKLVYFAPHKGGQHFYHYQRTGYITICCVYLCHPSPPAFRPALLKDGTEIQCVRKIYVHAFAPGTLVLKSQLEKL